LQFRTHTYRTVLTRSNSPVLLLYPCPSQPVAELAASSGEVSSRRAVVAGGHRASELSCTEIGVGVRPHMLWHKRRRSVISPPPKAALSFCNGNMTAPSVGSPNQAYKNSPPPTPPAVRACITFSPPLPHSSPSLRARSPRRSRKGYANRKETERERSSGDSKRTREESRQRREEVHFSPFGFPDSHGAMSERRRHLCACCCEVLVSTLARERRGGGERREGGRGGTGSMPPPLPLLCSSVFLLLLLCRPSLANGRAIRLDASSPEPSPQFVKGSVASSTVTASPPAGRLAPAGCVVGS
jgi:hypothetical protein